MPAHCRTCTEGPSYDQPLFECIACKNHFHSKCHRPRLQEQPKINWTCQRCLMRCKDKEERRYNDNASVSSHATSRAVSLVLSSPRASPAMSVTSHSVSSFTPEGGEPDPPSLITCSYPACTEKTLASEVLCHAHQAGLFAAPTSPKSSHPSQAPRSSSVNMHAGVDVGRPLLCGPNPNKVLPKNDKDRPILRRKTAPGDSLKSRQPPAVQVTVYSSDESTISPTSPQPVLARPPAYSAHGSPDNFQDLEHTRKRQKLSHPLNSHLEPRQNGAQTLGPDRVGFGGKHKLAKLQTHRTSSYPPTQQRPSRGPETERNGFKLSSPNRPSPVRKMAPLNPLRSIHPPATALPSTERQNINAEIAPPSALVNGFGPHAPNGSLQRTQKPPFHHTSDSPNFITKFNQPAALHNSNQTPATLNGHAEHGSANKGTNGWFNPGSQLQPAAQMDLNFFADRSDSQLRRPQTHLIPIPQIPKSEPPRVIYAEMIGPVVHQVNPVQPPMGVAVKTVDEAALDLLLYRQEGASTPPPGVRIPEPETPAPDPAPPDQPIYADVDPRIHWTLPQSDVWREKKIVEIAARGGRKANFGRAAASLKKQRHEEEESLAFEDALPEKVAENPAWARALKRLESEATEASASPGINGTPKRKPGPKRQLSNGSVSSSVRGNGPDVQESTCVGLRTPKERKPTEKAKLYLMAKSARRNTAVTSKGTQKTLLHDSPRAEEVKTGQRKAAKKRR